MNVARVCVHAALLVEYIRLQAIDLRRRCPDASVLTLSP